MINILLNVEEAVRKLTDYFAKILGPTSSSLQDLSSSKHVQHGSTRDGDYQVPEEDLDLLPGQAVNAEDGICLVGSRDTLCQITMLGMIMVPL